MKLIAATATLVVIACLALVSRAEDSTKPKDKDKEKETPVASKLTQWEYKVMNGPAATTEPYAESRGLSGDPGSNGWELVTVVFNPEHRDPQGKTIPELRYYFKRPKQG